MRADIRRSHEKDVGRKSKPRKAKMERSVLIDFVWTRVQTEDDLRRYISSPDIGIRAGLLDQFGDLWAELTRILDRIYSRTGVPALGNLKNSIAGFEHAACDIARFLAGQPNDDRRNPRWTPALYFFLGALS